MRRLGRFLDGLGVGADALNSELIDAFVAGEQRAGRNVPSDRWLRHVLHYLRALGAAPAPPVVSASPLAELIAEYRQWLVVERSLVSSTVYNYMHLTRRFLEATCDGELEVLLSFTAADLATYLRSMCQRYRARSINEVVVALRSLFRFLYLKGHIEAPLAQAVPVDGEWKAEFAASDPPARTGRAPYGQLQPDNRSGTARLRRLDGPRSPGAAPQRGGPPRVVRHRLAGR
jgi:integrase/recombinase XerD